MKKEYIIPNMQMVVLGQLQPLAESGPTPNGQNDPGMGGSGNSSRRRRSEWDDEEEDDF